MSTGLESMHKTLQEDRTQGSKIRAKLVPCVRERKRYVFDANCDYFLFRRDGGLYIGCTAHGGT